MVFYGRETPHAEGDYEPSTDAKLESSDLETRRRGQFLPELHGELLAKFPDDSYYPLLQKSMLDNWNLCLKDYGLPSPERLGQLPKEELRALYEELNLMGDRMREFEDDCSERSRIYAGKDEETDRLLGLQHQYYLSTAQAWVKANPGKVIPFDHLLAEDSGRTAADAAEGDTTDPREPEQSANMLETKGGGDGTEPTATQTPTEPDLGLEEIVREFILIRYGGETPRAESDYKSSTDAKLESTDPETRRRGEFESELRLEFYSKYSADPYYPLLQQSVYDDWDLCLKDYGIPSLWEVGAYTEEEQEALYEELNLVGDRMREFENDCWERSRIYAGRDEETDRILGFQHLYYLNAAQAWVKANPDKVVPLPG